MNEKKVKRLPPWCAVEVPCPRSAGDWWLDVQCTAWHQQVAAYCLWTLPLEKCSLCKRQSKSQQTIFQRYCIELIRKRIFCTNAHKLLKAYMTSWTSDIALVFFSVLVSLFVNFLFRGCVVDYDVYPSVLVYKCNAYIIIIIIIILLYHHHHHHQKHL